MPKSNSDQNNVSNLHDNYSTPTINLTEEPTMYEPMNNRRYGVTRKYHHNNKKHYVNVQYDNMALPRVVRIFSDSKYGTEYADIPVGGHHNAPTIHPPCFKNVLTLCFHTVLTICVTMLSPCLQNASTMPLKYFQRPLNVFQMPSKCF